MKFASPKTSESTILYHLKRNGIWRRDKAELSRKVTEQMVDEWVKRYEGGESLKQIAGGEVSPVTVYNHLKKRRLRLRDQVEAQIHAVTKYERAPFSGTPSDRAYILGFVWGDCSVEKHGRAIRVRSGTTHPDFVKLFKELFDSYGRVRLYPKRAVVTPVEWNLEVDLDGSFEFLMMKNMVKVPTNLAHSFAGFLAGFSDAEGSIFFHRDGGTFGFQISNTNLELLQAIQELLVAGGYYPQLYRTGSRLPSPHGASSEMWQLGFYRPQEVRNVLAMLPLRHREKATKAKMAIEFIDSELVLNTDGIPKGSTEYLAEIARGVDMFVKDAFDRVQNAT